MKTKRIIAVLAAVALTSVATLAFAQEHHAAPVTSEGSATHGAAHEAEPGEGAEHAEHEGHHGPAPINWTDIGDKTRPAFIALAINFGILLAIYFALGKKPVVEGLKKRRIDIGKDIDDARKMLEEAKERAKKYQADLKNADVDAASAKASLVTSGKGEVEHMLTEAQEKAERMKRDADRLVEQEQKQLRQDLTLETIDRAVTQAQKILEKQATSEDHARLAQELLAELARKPAAPKRATIAPPVASARPSGGAV